MMRYCDGVFLITFNLHLGVASLSALKLSVPSK